MEGVMKEWKEEEEAEVENLGLVRRQAHQQVTTITSFSDIHIQGQEISETKEDSSDVENKNRTSPSSDPIIPVDSTSPKNVTAESEKREEISETEENFSDIEKKSITSPSADPVISRDYSTPPKSVTIESERVGVITENIQLAKELYLESVYQKPPTQGFYCPNCRTCIQKVLILDTLREEPDVAAQPLPPVERFRCSTCFSFLIPIGSWVFPWLGHDKEEITEDVPETKVPAPDQVPPDSESQMLQPEPTVTNGAHKTQEVEQGPDGSRTKPSPWGVLASASAIATLKKPQLDISEIPEQQKPVEEVAHDGVSTDSSYQTIEIPEDEQGPYGSRIKPSRWGVLASASAIATRKKPQLNISKPPEQQRPVEEFVHDGVSTDSSYQAIEIPEGEQGPDGSRIYQIPKPSRWGVLASASVIARPKAPQVDISKLPEQQKPVEEVESDGESAEPLGSATSGPTTTADAIQEPGSSKTWDILKSIVYGGLIESIASLSIVASSASADATTSCILALSIANLIGGLFILVHHIWDLKSEQKSINELVDRYYLSLGKRENFYLHVFTAILSFLIFGLVPPLVYGFTFYETNNKDLTLVAVAGASVICIILLSIAKTYIQRTNTYITYLKTVLYYFSTGALSSVIAYLAGVLIRKLLDKLGIGSESSLGYNLMMPEMSIIGKPRFGSY